MVSDGYGNYVIFVYKDEGEKTHLIHGMVLATSVFMMINFDGGS